MNGAFYWRWKREGEEKINEKEEKDLKEDDFDFVLFYWHHDLTKSIYQYPSISTFRLSTYFSLCCENQNRKKKLI